jgi:hypothetical protein
VPAADTPVVALASPVSGDGATRTITLVAALAATTAHIETIEMMIETDPFGGHACWIAYDAATNTVRLADDTADGWWRPLPPGGTGVVSNAQCAIHAAGSAASTDSDRVTLTLVVTVDPGVPSGATMYGRARDVAGGGSHWQALGTWSVR